jgi:hypothetical protein
LKLSYISSRLATGRTSSGTPATSYWLRNAPCAFIRVIIIRRRSSVASAAAFWASVSRRSSCTRRMNASIDSIAGRASPPVGALRGMTTPGRSVIASENSPERRWRGGGGGAAAAAMRGAGAAAGRKDMRPAAAAVH